MGILKELADAGSFLCENHKANMKIVCKLCCRHKTFYEK